MRKVFYLLFLYAFTTLIGTELCLSAPPKSQSALCAKTIKAINSNDLLEALNRAILQMPKEDRGFWISPEIDWFEENFAKQTPLIEPPLPYKAKTFDRSFKQVVTIFETGRRFDNTWVLINGDLFLEGYYRITRYFDSDHKKSHSAAQELMQLPYFRFDPNSNSYHYSRSGAHHRLLSHLEANWTKNGKVTLYRGLNKAQTYYLQLLKELNHNNSKPPILQKLKQAIQKEWSTQDYSSPWIAEFDRSFEEIDLSNPSDRQKLEADLVEFFLSENRWRESLFTTPTLEKAQGYADPYVIKADFTIAELRDLADKKQVYIGVEYEDFELLFHGPEALRLFAKSSELMK